MKDPKKTTQSTLYRKYRPQSFDDVIGQEHITKTLTNAIKTGRLGHAYLLTGSRGTGKTTIARLFATAINCQKRDNFQEAPKNVCEDFLSGRALDLIEIDAASHTGVDNIRELREMVALAPSEAPYKVYIIDEVHMLSTGAFNALLKTLEEPPAHAIFILATTDIHKVPETIISRCQRFDFTRISIPHIIEKIQKIADAEKVKIEEEAAELIAIAANGGMRDAESLLAQVFALEDKAVTAKEVSQILGATTTQDVLKIIEAFSQKDIETAIGIISNIADSGYNLTTFAAALILKLRALLFYTLDQSTEATNNIFTLTTAEKSALQSTAKQTTTKDVLIMLDECDKARTKISGSVIPQLPLEIAAVIICKKPATPSPQKPQQPQKSTTQKKPTDQPSAQEATPIKIASKTQTKPPEQTREKEPLKPPLEALEQLPKDTSITLDIVQERWPYVLEKLHKEVPSVALLLADSMPSAYESMKITIPVKYELHKEKLADASTILTLNSVFDTIFGTSLKVVAEKQEREQKDTAVLAHARNLMGGTIVST